MKPLDVNQNGLPGYLPVDWRPRRSCDEGNFQFPRRITVLFASSAPTGTRGWRKTEKRGWVGGGGEVGGMKGKTKDKTFRQADDQRTSAVVYNK